MRSFSNILPNFATNLHLLVDSIRWLICNKNEEKSEKNFVVSEIIANFAPKCLESIHSILTF